LGGKIKTGFTRERRNKMTKAMKTFLKKEEIKIDKVKFSYWHKESGKLSNDFFRLGFKTFKNFHLN
jgi:histidinol phosphatase-like enzyme